MRGGCPADTAVLVIGHGERGGRRDNALLLGVCDEVRSRGFPRARTGVLSGEPSLEQALADLPAAGAGDEGEAAVVVYPFFMSRGYFVGRAIPDRLAKAGLAGHWHMLAPLGLDPGLPTIIRQSALAAAAGAGWRAAATRLLLVGHGSRSSSASADATRSAAAEVMALGGFGLVETAFLEEPPFYADVLPAGRLQTVVVGFFSGDGLHAGDDLPAPMAGAALPVVYTGPVGAAPGIGRLVAEALLRSLGALARR